MSFVFGFVGRITANRLHRLRAGRTVAAIWDREFDKLMNSIKEEEMKVHRAAEIASWDSSNADGKGLPYRNSRISAKKN